MNFGQPGWIPGILQRKQVDLQPVQTIDFPLYRVIPFKIQDIPDGMLPEPLQPQEFLGGGLEKPRRENRSARSDAGKGPGRYQGFGLRRAMYSEDPGS